MAAPTPRSSTPIAVGHALIVFGAVPHHQEDLDRILAWIGVDGHIVDTRVDQERQISACTPFQYHAQLEHTLLYTHFPITDRSVPTKRVRCRFDALLDRLQTYPRVYVHCRGGQYTCALVRSGLNTQALYAVWSAHQARETMSAHLRKIGAPQNKKQKQYVRDMEKEGPCQLFAEEPIHFYKANEKDVGFLSNLWGIKGTYKCKTLGGSTLVIHNQSWPTVEHYFQAQKFDLVSALPGESPETFDQKKAWGARLMQIIRTASTGAGVFRLGNIGHPNRAKSFKNGYPAAHRLYVEPGISEAERKAPTLNSIVQDFEGRVRVRQDWSDRRNEVMMTALAAKFRNPLLRALLLATGDRPIHEHTKRDLHWGDGMEDKNGADVLGQMLTMQRSMARVISLIR